jgi:hypothetical protein
MAQWGGGGCCAEKNKSPHRTCNLLLQIKLLPQHFVSKNYNLKSSLKISSQFSPTNRAKRLIKISYASVLFILEIWCLCIEEQQILPLTSYQDVLCLNVAIF